MPEIKWVKLSTDIFDNRKIRQIESMPDGDAMIVIWMKLLCLAGRTNDGGQIYFTPAMPYTAQMLATEMGKPLKRVQAALDVFKRFGMIEYVDDLIILPNWEKYQNVDGMDRIREQNRARKQKQRSRDSHVTVTQCHATEEEREEDIEEDKDISSFLPCAGEAVKMSYLAGALGRGYVMMSEEQVDDLLEKLSVDEFNHYVAVIADCEERGKKFGKTHYQAILDMVAKDRRKQTV